MSLLERRLLWTTV